MAQDSLFYNVGLLWHCEGANGGATFTDSSPRAKVATASGAVTSNSQKRFGTTSARFNTGDYITVPASTDFGFGVDDFTVEMWVRPAMSGDSTQMFIDFRASDAGIPLAIGMTVAGAVRYYDGGTVRTGGSMVANTWAHVAWCRKANVNTIYLDGVAVSTYTATQDFGASKGLCIGANVIKSAERFNGFLDDIRITKGFARYDGTFTPPAAAFPDESDDVDPPSKDAHFSDVILLLHCDGADGSLDVPDSSLLHNTVSVVGTAAISTTKGKSGGASLSTGSHGVLIPSRSEFDFGSGDMTIEAWFSFTTTTSESTLITREWVASPWTGGWVIQMRSGTSGPLAVYMAEWSTSTPLMKGTTTSHGDGNWHHVAWTREGNVHRLFLDGVLEATVTTSTAFASAPKRLAVGYDPTFGPRPLSGYVDEVRITKGRARYVKNFAVPPAPFPRAGSLSGVVKDASGAFAARLVRAIRKDTGAFVGEVTSDGTTGIYSIGAGVDGPHTLIAYPAPGEDLPALVLDEVLPV